MSDFETLLQKLGIPGQKDYSPTVRQAVQQFQSAQGLIATGEADPATLAEAGVYDPVAGVSKKFTKYLSGGKEPGGFGRDISSAMNQVPGWLWLTLGVGMSGLAYLAYRVGNPKGKKSGRRR